MEELPMVETHREYILQWTGHAASVAERFSGLLARQALVDITLLCQNQHLRVHKLVLASCSVYFEEMLEQDLGQDPTIVLNDLHFNILKAMIEFMYCGETTIAHCHLQSLLNAARVFKIKQLESLVISTIDAKDLGCDSAESSDHETEKEKYLPSIHGPTDPQSPNSPPDISPSPDIFEDILFTSDPQDEPAQKFESDDTKNGLSAEDKFNMCDRPPELIPQSVEIPETSLEPPQKDQLNSARVTGQCSRVYTHKKRKVLDKTSQPISLKVPQLCDTLTTDCIDLSYEKNCDISSARLGTSLDLDPEYTFNLTPESPKPDSPTAQTPPIIDTPKVISNDSSVSKLTSPFKKIPPKMKNLFSPQNHCSNIENSKPVLRRSVRLNQLENDDTVNNNNQRTNCNRPKDCRTQELKQFKKLSKLKSLGLNDRNVESDENIKHTINSRSLRSNRKLVVNSRHKFAVSKEEQKTKSSRLKEEKMEKTRSQKNDNGADNNDNDDSNDDIIVRLNTIDTVDRSLWGDMSDLLENCQHNVVLPHNTQSKEIPFAVGLLPLRAALERMQAIPDYQPRKTRSSVTSYKIDGCGGKRKANGDAESIVISKKRCSPERSINSDTVCHIHIHTTEECSQKEIVAVKPIVGVESVRDER